MARRRGSLAEGTALLTTLKGGINRSAGEARGDQLVDALDVWVDDGDLARRPAWKSIGHAVPFFLPGGRCIVKATDDNSTFTTFADRRPVGAVSKKYWYIGCTEQFDGIFWPSRWQREIGPTDSFTAGRVLSCRTAVNTLTDNDQDTKAFDTTRRRDRSGDFIIPLIGRGCLTWHKESFASWPTHTIDGVAAYWIKISLLNTAGTAVVFTPHMQEDIKVFHLAPVNGLVQTKVKRKSTLIVGSDRSPPRGLEKGAELGTLANERIGVQRIWYGIDEGPGVYDVMTVGSTSRGTTDKLTKDRTFTVDNANIPLVWRAGQHRGGRVVGRLDTTSEAGVDVTSPTASSVTLAEAVTTNDNHFEHCRIRVTKKGAGGASLNYERAVVSSVASTGLLNFEDAFDTTPDTNNDVVVHLPSAKLRFLHDIAALGGDALDPSAYEIYQTDAGHTLALTGVGAETLGVPYAPIVDDEHVGIPVYWQIVQELRWVQSAGLHWDAAFDPSTDQVFLTNGKGTLLYDGQKLRPATAATFANLRLREYFGIDVATADPAAPNASYIAQIIPFPQGKFFAVWDGCLFVGGFTESPEVVRYSVIGEYTWWLGGRNFLLPENLKGEIRGMKTFGDRLIVFTATSMFEVLPTQTKSYGVRAISYQMGFTSHWGVQAISANGSGLLVGPTPWGLMAWSGAEPQVLLDGWDRIFDEPPGARDLASASSAVLQNDGYYLLGVGNRILIWDWRARAFWLFSCPWGVASMVVETDARGKERLLVGTKDGHIVTFAPGKLSDDDISAVTGRAQCAWKSPNVTGEAALRGGNLLTQELGSSSAITVKLLVDRRTSVQQSVVLYPSTQRSGWGTAWGSGATALKWAEPEMRTLEFGIRAGTRVEQLSIRVESARPFRIGAVEIFGRALSHRVRSG